MIDINCAELILNSKLNLFPQMEIKSVNQSIFRRIELYYKGDKSMKEFHEEFIPKIMKNIPEFITPPITLNNSNQFSCFIATKTKDLFSSRKRMSQIFQYLKKLNFELLNQYE